MNYPMRFPFLKILWAGFLFCSLLVSAQYEIPEKPSVLWPVHDEAGILSETEKNDLNQKLIKFEDSTSVEIEVIIIPSTKGEDVNFLATQFGEKWGIGKKKIDNGVVFLIATEDHTMSIQQGRAVEQYLTASVVGQILDYLVTPYFKKGEWYNGINHGTSAIIDALQGKFKPIEKPARDGGLSFSHILIILFILLILFSVLSRNDGDNNDDGDFTISRRGRRMYPGGFFPFPMGGGGFGGSGCSGGGFGGFGGGGSFGGGGASGGW
jgi:uncharacterized protein